MPAPVYSTARAIATEASHIRRRVAIGHQDGRCLLHHLLVAPLHGALPVEQVQDGAVCVPHDLDLDVTGSLEIPLEEHLVRAEGGGRLTLGRCHRIGELARLAHEAHAAAAAAG